VAGRALSKKFSEKASIYAEARGKGIAEVLPDEE
jgi:hypothetical protein